MGYGRAMDASRPARPAVVRRAVAALFILPLALGACGSAPASPDGASAPAGSAAPAGGTVTSGTFSPAVTYTLPGGWETVEDLAGFLHLRPAGSEVTGIYLFRDPQPASQDPSCPETAEPGIGTSAKELTSWIAGLPGLVASAPAPETIGGLTGYVVDVGIREGWTASCSFANGSPTVPLLVGAAGYRWVVVGSERLRLYVLDLPSGGTIAVDVDAFDGRLIDELIAEAAPILESLRVALR